MKKNEEQDLIDGIWTKEEYECAKAWGWLDDDEEEDEIVQPPPGLKSTFKREWSMFVARHRPPQRWMDEAKVAGVALAIGYVLGLFRIGWMY